jgi:hypothetical protein
VTSGRHLPGDEWEPFYPLMACFGLETFTEGETRDYLHQQGITEKARMNEILAFSGGVPVLVSTLDSAKGGNATEAAHDLVERYLTWVDDPRRRQAALKCAAARRLNQDVVGAIMGEEDAGALFDWLSEMPFVQSRPGYWEYHPKVRGLVLQYAHSRSERESSAVHASLMGYHRNLLVEKKDDAHYRDKAWRQHALETLYQGLMAESTEAVREGLGTFLLALRRHYPFAGEVVVTWLQATIEQGTIDEANRWAQVLGTVWSAIEDESWPEALPAREALEKREDLCVAAKSEGFLYRWARLR